MFGRLFERYFVWKYGTCFAPKNPIGFSPYMHRRPLLKLIVYKIRYTIWLFDKWVDQKYGATRKADWLQLRAQRKEKKI